MARPVATRFNFCYLLSVNFRPSTTHMQFIGTIPKFIKDLIYRGSFHETVTTVPLAGWGMMFSRLPEKAMDTSSKLLLLDPDFYCFVYWSSMSVLML